MRSAERQVDLYLAMTLNDDEEYNKTFENPLAFWMNQWDAFRDLKEVTLQILTIPAVQMC